MRKQSPNRVFVPLATTPFNWFKSGLKRWELRVDGRQYTRRNIRAGRRVELRRGYATKDSLWGVVGDVVVRENVDDIFEAIDYRQIIPTAVSKEDAIGIASDILKISRRGGARLIAFEVDVYGQD